MPEHLKALIVILVLATVVFAFAKAPACALASTAGDFERRRNLWFAITLTAFLAHNFWIYVIVAAVLLLFAVGREPNKLALFFFLLFAVPAISAPITGLGIITNLFEIHYIRLLALAILLPTFLSLRKQPDIERFGRSLPDKLMAGYIILIFLLIYTASTFTNALRQGVFYPFIDIFLPYYVASRSLKNLQGFRDALIAFIVAAMVLSVISGFEFSKHWLLYPSLRDALGATWGGYGRYLLRESILRTSGSVGEPIALGYVLAVAVGLFLYLRRLIPNSRVWTLGLVVLSVGLITPLSRGPWVGVAVMLLVFVATAPPAVRSFAKFGVYAVIIAALLLATPVGERIIDYLPFVGTIEESTVTYRQRLLEISIQVIMQNPYFGAFDYLNAPEMQELKYGGMIDIVNSYVGVALNGGLVGLSIFSGFFIAVAIGIFKAMRGLPDRNDERYLLGQALLSTLLGILVIIFTVSSVTVIPVIYWSVAGLGAAYARMLARAKSPETARPAGFQPATTKNG